MAWDPTYVENLREALAQVSQNSNAMTCAVGARNCGYQGFVTIKGRPGPRGWSRSAGFTDLVSMNLIQTHLIESRPAVLVTVEDDQGRVAWRGCSRYSELDNIISGVVPSDRLVQPTENGILVNTWLVFDARMPMNLAPTAPNIERASFEIVRADRCPNN